LHQNLAEITKLKKEPLSCSAIPEKRVFRKYTNKETMKNMKRIKCLMLGFGLLISGLLLAQSKDMLLADPFILEANGQYYIYGTGAKNGILVYQSKDLKHWSGPCGATNGLALHKKDTGGERGFWAPEVYKIGSRFLMTFSADEHIRYAVSDSPTGPFVQDSIKSYLDEKGIDSDIFMDDDGTPYMFWVRFTGGNVIYGAEMTKDLKHIKMETVKRLIDATDQTWERTTAEPMARVAEGPMVLKHHGLYYLTYSCNHFMSQDYAVGYAVAKSPLGPWTRYEGNPILHKHGGYMGTGHHAIFKTTSGKMYIVYHAHFSDTVVSPRRTLISPISFIKKGDQEVLKVSDKVIVPQLKK